MVDAWPDTLPHCMPLDGQSEGLVSNLVRSQTDTGPAQLRRRSSLQIRSFQASIVLDRDGLLALRTFIEVNLLGGSLAFTFPAQSEALDGDWLVRFADNGLPSWTSFGRKYRVGFALEIFDFIASAAPDDAGSTDFSIPGNPMMGAV